MIKRIIKTYVVAVGAMLLGSGTVVAADNPVVNYWNADDGRTLGMYVSLTGASGSVGDIKTQYDYNTTADATYVIDDAKGAILAFGYDWGKLRFDWRLGANHTEVDTIDGVTPTTADDNDVAFGYTSINLAWDIYRFSLPLGMGITPYVGGGYGYGGGWMTARKILGQAGDAVNTDKFAVGRVYTAEVGALFEIWRAIGITAGYQYMDHGFGEGGNGKGENIETHMATAGLRLTF